MSPPAQAGGPSLRAQGHGPRIALIFPRLSHQGGTERRALSFAQALVQRGLEIELHCAGADIPPPEGASLTLFPGRAPRGRRAKAAWMSASAEAAGRGAALRVGFLRAEGFDVLRAGGGCHADYMEAMGRSGPVERWERDRDERAVLSARLVVVNSALAGRGLRSRYGLPAERLRLVRNGVQFDAFGGQAPAGPPRVVFIGHGFARKGLGLALRAFQRLAAGALRGHALWVLGDDPQAWRYRLLAVALGIGDRVRFFGGSLGVAEALAGARALLLPTAYDPSANAVLEAMAAGVPPVTTRWDGAAELLPEPWLAVHQRSPAAVAAALERAVQAPGLGEACRHVAAAHGANGANARLLGVLAELNDALPAQGQGAARWVD